MRALRHFLRTIILHSFKHMIKLVLKKGIDVKEKVSSPANYTILAKVKLHRTAIHLFWKRSYENINAADIPKNQKRVSVPQLTLWIKDTLYLDMLIRPSLRWEKPGIRIRISHYQTVGHLAWLIQQFFIYCSCWKVRTLKMSYMCNICGYIYDGDDFKKEPNDYQCPLCDASRSEFTERNIEVEVCNATDEFHRIKNSKIV